MNDGQLPPVPLDAVAGHSSELGVTLFMGAMAALTLVFALVHWRRTGRPIFLLLFCVGGLMVFFEPMVDTVGAVWFPANSMVALELYHRIIPIWVCLTYFSYFGIGVGAAWLAIRAQPTRRRLWTLWCAFIVADVVMEVVLLHLDGIYLYYAAPPLVVAKFPLWWAPVNSLIIVGTAAVIRRLEPTLRGPRYLLIIPAGLSCSAAGNAVAGWPSWLVINSDLGPLPTQLGGVATFAAAAWIVGGVLAPLVGPGGATAVPSTEPTTVAV